MGVMKAGGSGGAYICLCGWRDEKGGGERNGGKLKFVDTKRRWRYQKEKANDDSTYHIIHTHVLITQKNQGKQRQEAVVVG